MFVNNNLLRVSVFSQLKHCLDFGGTRFSRILFRNVFSSFFRKFLYIGIFFMYMICSLLYILCNYRQILIFITYLFNLTNKNIITVQIKKKLY